MSEDESPLDSTNPIEENATEVMVYTDDFLILGHVVTKIAIRVSTWLRTQAIPQYLQVYEARITRFDISAISKPQNFKELYIPSSQVIAFHIKPPEQDPLDYDPDEPMRKMEPVKALVGYFKFDGYLRMSTQTNLSRFLDVTKEPFISMYDIEISQPDRPTSGVMRIPFALLRGDRVLFSQ